MTNINDRNDAGRFLNIYFFVFSTLCLTEVFIANINISVYKIFREQRQKHAIERGVRSDLLSACKLLTFARI